MRDAPSVIAGHPLASKGNGIKLRIPSLADHDSECIPLCPANVWDARYTTVPLAIQIGHFAGA
jgi:hypothetical protein